MMNRGLQPLDTISSRTRVSLAGIGTHFVIHQDGQAKSTADDVLVQRSCKEQLTYRSNQAWWDKECPPVLRSVLLQACVMVVLGCQFRSRSLWCGR